MGWISKLKAWVKKRNTSFDNPHETWLLIFIPEENNPQKLVQVLGEYEGLKSDAMEMAMVAVGSVAMTRGCLVMGDYGVRKKSEFESTSTPYVGSTPY